MMDYVQRYGAGESLRAGEASLSALARITKQLVHDPDLSPAGQISQRAYRSGHSSDRLEDVLNRVFGIGSAGVFRPHGFGRGTHPQLVTAVQNPSTRCTQRVRRTPPRTKAVVTGHDPMTTIDPAIAQAPPSDTESDSPIEKDLRPHLHVHSVTLTGLFILAILFTLYVGRVVFLPITIAILFAVLFAPLLRRLKQLKIPEPLSAAILLMLLVAILGYGITRLAEPASEWAAKVPDAFRETEYKLRVIKQPMQEVTKATELLSKAATLDGTKKVQQVEVKSDAWPMKFFSMTGEFLIEIATTLILLYFLLSSGDLFLQKLVKVLPGWSDKRRAVEIVREIEGQLFQYLFTVSFINLGLGILVGLAMYILGMPNPILWGAMAALLTFIPYLGHVFGNYRGHAGRRHQLRRGAANVSRGRSLLGAGTCGRVAYHSHDSRPAA